MNTSPYWCVGRAARLLAICSICRYVRETPPLAVSHRKMEKSIPEIIAKKRDGLELSKEEIEFFMQGVVSEKVDKSQIGKYKCV